MLTRGFFRCPALANCTLTPIPFGDRFVDLNAIQINVTVAGEPKIWFMDDLELGWFNNTCSAGLYRQQAHVPNIS
jgi:hypothetical protein